MELKVANKVDPYLRCYHNILEVEESNLREQMDLSSIKVVEGQHKEIRELKAERDRLKAKIKEIRDCMLQERIDNFRFLRNAP